MLSLPRIGKRTNGGFPQTPDVRNACRVMEDMRQSLRDILLQCMTPTSGLQKSACEVLVGGLSSRIHGEGNRGRLAEG